jgi:hypothetical protein
LVLLATTGDPKTSITPKDLLFQSGITSATSSSWADEVEAVDLAKLKAESLVNIEEGKTT